MNNKTVVVPKAPGPVLSTLNSDGTRHKIRPKVSRGRFWKRRGVLAYALIALFIGLPLLEINGHPALLLDVAGAQLFVFGLVFRPSDGVLLMLLGLTLVLAVFLITALLGRAWCGWACPQTIYLEWVYRPIERLIEGTPKQQRELDASPGMPKRRLLTYAVFAVLSFFVGNIFLAYFVGVQTLLTWIQSSPLQHPGGFTVMALVGSLMFLDFAWFREQTCILACPYGRLQTVLLDQSSTIVGYDPARGEPRGKPGKLTHAAPRNLGDCIDCHACVATCPTGIDIRDGLQMECVSCTQCIDACDAIMDKVGRPRGLIRYSSQEELAGKPNRILRTRTIVYPALLALVVILLIWQLGDRPTTEVWPLRAQAQSFAVLADGRVSSQTPLRVENRQDEIRRYTVELHDAGDVTVAAPRAPIQIDPGASSIINVITLAPRSSFAGGERRATIVVRDDSGWQKRLHVTLMGPTTQGASR